MAIDISSLPNDVESLKSLLLKSITENQKKDLMAQQLQAEIARLNTKIEYFNLRFFAPRSEKLKIETGQLMLFNEAEDTASKAAKAEETEQITYSRRKGRKSRELDLSRFPSVEVVQSTLRE